MPSLIESLHSRDLGHLRIVAERWGVELAGIEKEPVLEEISAALLDAGNVDEIVATLPPEARQALLALSQAGGRLAWVNFARRFGELQEAGAGRRDREQVHLHPLSIADTLFYRALLARSFFDTPAGPQEFSYIPDDLFPLVKQALDQQEVLRISDRMAPAADQLGRAASPRERQFPIPHTDRILDDACSLLACLRTGLDPAVQASAWPYPVPVLASLLTAAGLIGTAGIQPEAVKKFLAAPRRTALQMVLNAWHDSEGFNELHQVPGLVCEGEWSNQPRGTRQFLLAKLSALPQGQWWSLAAFIRGIKDTHPDFQRPAGDYDSWFIRRTADGSYLRGFEQWDAVDGALLNYLITGPLHWLGMVSLACPEEGAAPSAFMLRNPDEPLSPAETGKLHVTAQGRLDLPRRLPRAARYQIARFCEWEEEKPDGYRYRVSTASLKNARSQGLKAGQLLVLLRKHTAAPVPPPFVRALQRWEEKGTEARLAEMLVLRVGSPDVLSELRQSRAGRFLGEPLGPTAVAIKPGAQAKILAALAEMGLLAEIE
jgi:hypothetical protein